MAATETRLEVSGPSRPNGPEQSIDYALVMTPCLTKGVIVAETYGIVDHGVDLPARDNARLLAAAWNSYQRLGESLQLDPLALAEADVLYDAYHACAKLVQWMLMARPGDPPPMEAIAKARAVCTRGCEIQEQQVSAAPAE